MISTWESSPSIACPSSIIEPAAHPVASIRSRTVNPPDDIAQELDACATRSRDATAQGAQAFARLLQLAEQRNSGQIVRVVQFIAATYNGQAFAFDLFDLRALDVAISDDMLRCLDALRWARADLYTLIPDGDARVCAVIERWGLKWPESA